MGGNSRGLSGREIDKSKIVKEAVGKQTVGE